MSDWKPSACILCESNCGIEVQTGGDDNREIVRIRGDKAHPASQGYLCQKASRLNYYQKSKDRISTPLRKNANGDFEAINWDTAIAEIAQRLTRIRDTQGGDKIFYYGGGGQGNHLPGAYAASTRKVLGSVYRSSALAQEKTGEFWVNGKLFGSSVRGDFERTDVAVFVGKNPWHSHGIPRARAWLRDFSKDSSKQLIVIDPVITETAELADIHLRVKPGCDVWLLSAIIALIIQRKWYKHDWLQQHTTGLDSIIACFSDIDIEQHCTMSGVALKQVELAAKVIASADSAAFFEDLGIQMNRHSTLNSYLEKLIWVLCGNLGNCGGQYIPATVINVAGSGRVSRKSPVADAPIISGMVPCNVIADEILSDHPDRYQAMIIETANPVHSLADSHKFQRALETLDTVVVIDIAMSETARCADYILPASNQYEKAEATFFNFEFPNNYFHLRKALFEPLRGTLPEAEIHARLIEAMGAMPTQVCEVLNGYLANGDIQSYSTMLMQQMANPDVSKVMPVVLYRTLGTHLPKGSAEGAILMPLILQTAMAESSSLERAGFTGSPIEQAQQLFNAIIQRHSGVIFSSDNYDSTWNRMGNDGKIHLVIDELLTEVEQLSQSVSITTQQYPYLLMAGERRDYSANTIYRDADWRRKDKDGSLRISPDDASKLKVEDGDQLQIATAVGSAVATVVVTQRMQKGHVSLPNGFGLDNVDGNRFGVAINELTATDQCDPFAKTPWHKTVAAQLQKVG